MADGDSRSGGKAIALRIRLPCATAADLARRYGEEIRRGTLFIRTRTPKIAGTLIRFDLLYAGGALALRGAARVTSARSAADHPSRPGMQLQLLALDAASHRLLRELNLPSGLPTLKPSASPPPRRPSPDDEQTEPHRNAPAFDPFVLGIDFGHDALRLARVQNGEPALLPVIAFSAEGRGAKRTMGRSPAALKPEAFFRLASESTPAPMGDTQRTVLAVPASFGDRRRAALLQAAADAGLQVEQLVSEPVAAAVAISHRNGFYGRLLICDLGGGTFDISVLRIHGRHIEVLATGGDADFGGTDFDRRIAQVLATRFEAKTGAPPPLHPSLERSFLKASEEAKIALDNASSYPVWIPPSSRFPAFATTLTRTELEEATKDMVDHALKLIAGTLGRCHLRPTDVDEILLLGRQSRMPAIRDALKAYFGKAPTVADEHLVALGAGLLAHTVISQDGGPWVLVDLLPASLRIRLSNGRTERLIERGAPLPHACTHIASVRAPGTAPIEFEFFQGESDVACDDEFLGRVRIDDLPAPAQIALTLRISGDGLLSVSIRDEATTEDRILPIDRHGFQERPVPMVSNAPSPGIRGLFLRLFRRSV